MLLRVDPTSPVPMFDQLAGALRAAILSGDAAPGSRLPSARELAASLDINLHTVLRAYQMLRDEGFLELKRGRGAVVIGPGADGYTDLMAAISQTVRQAKSAGVDAAALSALIREIYK